MLFQFVSTDFLPQALKLQGEQHVSQFLMNLRSEFEPIRAALMNREITLDLDTCVQEVLQEEICLLSTHYLNAEPKALLTPSADETTMFTARGQKPPTVLCKKYGHVARDCQKTLFCNYYRRNGHVISNCT